MTRTIPDYDNACAVEGLEKREREGLIWFNEWHWRVYGRIYSPENTKSIFKEWEK